MKKPRVVDEYRLTNRQMEQQTNKGKFWCGGCDAELVGKVGKCPRCGCENWKGGQIKQ